MRYPFDNWTVVNYHSNQEVVMDVVEREIEIEAPVEEVWEAIATEEGRERWLESEAPEVHVETVEEPTRLVWWWAGEETWSRVEIELVPAVSSTRVLVTESRQASFPLTLLMRAFAAVTA